MVRKGDKNTKFFQLSTSIRHKNNKISCIFDQHNHTISDEAHIRNLFVHHYQCLWHPCASNTTADLTWLDLPRLNHSWWNSLTAPITSQEVKDSLWQLGSGKAPGPDRFTVEFYKSYWDIVGEDITAGIKNFFSSGLLPKDWCDTLIIFIQKKTKSQIVN